MTFQNKLITVAVVMVCIGAIQTLKTGTALQNSKIELAQDVLVTYVNVPTLSRYNSQSFIKPSLAELRKILTPLQYQVTQEEGTERPYTNEYDKNTNQGLYVDIV